MFGYETFAPRHEPTGANALDNLGWFLSSLCHGQQARIQPIPDGARLRYADSRPTEEINPGSHLIEASPTRDTLWFWALLHYGYWQAFSGVGSLK